MHAKKTSALKRCFGILGIVLVALTQRGAAESNFFALGDLPGGKTISSAVAVDALGTVVVGFSSANEAATFVWNESDGIVNILEPSFSVGRVSADGTTVVGSFRNGAHVEPFLWTAGVGLVSLGLPPGETPNGGSFAADISGNASVIVGITVFEGEGHAFRWTSPDGFVNISGDLPGEVLVSQAMAVSDDGESIAGDFTTTDGVRRAFHWTSSGGGTDLGDLPGGSEESSVFDVSADGDWVVGTSSSSASDVDPFLWSQTTGITSLGAPASTLTVPFGVTDSGHAVVGRSVVLGVSSDAFVWTEARGMEPLQSLLTNRFGLGPQLTDWTLTSANDISADGRFLVGEGINPDGNTEAWLVRLDHPVFVPEPCSISLATLSLCMVLGIPRTLFSRKKVPLTL